MKIGRRGLLRGGAAVAVGAAVPVSLSHLFARKARAESYGPLVEDPDGVLDLPEGFSYRILQERHEPMDDGYRVPGRPDAMACFEGAGGTWMLMRNHEVSAGSTGDGPYRDGQSPPTEAYTDDGMGGVTRVVIDPSTGNVVSSNLVLVGTVRNCAGGPSPWGWLTCEENVDSGHGYVFLTRTDASSVASPERIVGYGRYNHEAVAIDPATYNAYLTEDRSSGRFYRFVPDSMGEPFEGTLQAMRVVGMDDFDTSSDMEVGDRLEVEWVDIDEPDPSGDTVRDEAQGKGAARVERGEGIWWFDGAAYFTATSGGPAGAGQVFRYTPSSEGDGGELELLAQSEDTSELNKPDNLTVASWGDVFIAEDASGTNYIRILHPDGTISDFARNALSGSEFAGVCFSPDDSTLFVNIQADGLTLAITGPFYDAPPPDGGVDDGAVADGGGSGGDAGSAGDSGTTGGRDSGTTGGRDAGSGGGGADDSGGGGCSVATPGRRASGTGLLGAALAAVGWRLWRRGRSEGDDDTGA